MKISQVLAAACLSISAFGCASASVPQPPLTPMFCAKTVCVFARGPYAVDRRFSFADEGREGVAITFQDGTVISFGAVPTRAPCRDFDRRWRNSSNLSSVVFLCLGSKVSPTNTVVAVKIESRIAPMLDRFQKESEICVWQLSLAKMMNNETESLLIGNSTCVGDRLGLALPARGSKVGSEKN
jgi:hypothetical protein